VKISIENWGSGSFDTPEIVGKPHEAGLLKLAIDKAKDKLGWEPQFDATEAVQWTMDWYKNSDSDPLKFTQDQIDRFFSI
jgi:CDP-glucose 4,6-dehydratase